MPLTDLDVPQVRVKCGQNAGPDNRGKLDSDPAQATRSSPTLSVLIVESGLKNDQVGADDPIDEPMFLGDAPRPHITG